MGQTAEARHRPPPSRRRPSAPPPPSGALSAPAPAWPCRGASSRSPFKPIVKIPTRRIRLLVVGRDAPRPWARRATSSSHLQVDWSCGRRASRHGELQACARGWRSTAGSPATTHRLSYSWAPYKALSSRPRKPRPQRRALPAAQTSMPIANADGETARLVGTERRRLKHDHPCTPKRSPHWFDLRSGRARVETGLGAARLARSAWRPGMVQTAGGDPA